MPKKKCQFCKKHAGFLIPFFLLSFGVLAIVQRINNEKASLDYSGRAGSSGNLALIGKDRFGVNYIFHCNAKSCSDNYVSGQSAKLKDLGAGWLRSAGKGDATGFHWRTVQPRDGSQNTSFDFSLPDIRASKSAQYGLSQIGLLEFQPDYQGNPGAIPDYAKDPSTRYGFSDAKYLVYLNKVVERYDGDGKEDLPGLTQPVTYWEIGNEVLLPQMFSGTIADYAHILQISYQNIKSNCSNCQVLIGGWVTGLQAPKFQEALDGLESVLMAGGGNYFDIMNFHNYAEEGDFLTYLHAKGFKDLLSKYGFQKPMWITEANTKLYKERKNGRTVVHTVKEQAEDLVKRIVTAFDAGVSKFFWHGLAEGTGSSDPGVGFFDENGNPKPIFYNYRYLSSNIGDFTAVKRIDLKNLGFYLYQFDTKGGRVYVLWSQAGEATMDLSAHFTSTEIPLTVAIVAVSKSTFDTVKVRANQVPFSQTPAFVNLRISVSSPNTK